MNYLADTQTLIWYLEGNPKLSEKAENTIKDNNNKLLITLKF